MAAASDPSPSSKPKRVRFAEEDEEEKEKKVEATEVLPTVEAGNIFVWIEHGKLKYVRTYARPCLCIQDSTYPPPTLTLSRSFGENKTSLEVVLALSNRFHSADVRFKGLNSPGVNALKADLIRLETVTALSLTFAAEAPLCVVEALEDRTALESLILNLEGSNHNKIYPRVAMVIDRNCLMQHLT